MCVLYDPIVLSAMFVEPAAHEAAVMDSAGETSMRCHQRMVFLSPSP
jgi:hypothetical protein